VTHILVMGLPLAVGLALALLAAGRSWAPPLWVALAVGTALRLLVFAIAAGDSFQPYDLAHDFLDTADAVRAGHDPLVYVREGGWHFLPFLAYVLAAQRELGDLLGLSWNVVSRVIPILADIALIPLVGRLAGEGRRATCSFQYACLPLGLMVSAIHGQFSSLTLLFGVGALLAARADRPHVAGPLMGLAATSASWTAVLLPGVLLAVPGLRRRLTVLGWTAAVPGVFLLSSAVFLGTPVGRLPATAVEALSTRPVAGDWWWSALVTGGHQVVSPTLSHIGTPILLVGLLAAGGWWRRADPLDLTLALVLAFLLVTYRFGAQYLLWPVPYLLARARRGTWPAITVAGIWAWFGYVPLTRLHAWDWVHAHTWWVLSSVVVIPFLIYALPPRHRPAEAVPEPEPVRPPSAHPAPDQQVRTTS
jgi:hypothetical protein